MSIAKVEWVFSFNSWGCELFGRQGMRQLWFHFNAALASRRHWPLLVQRLRSLPQDEQRHQSPPVEASSSTGEFHFDTNSTRFLHLQAMRAIALMINSYKVFYLCQVPCGIMLKFILKFATMGNSFFLFQLWIIQGDFFRRRCDFFLTNTSFDKNLAERYQTTGSLLHELWNHHDDFMAPQRGGWAGLQRLRTLP